MSKIIKYCPICGGVCSLINDTEFHYHQRIFETPLIYCVRCSVCGLMSAWYGSPEEAIQHWNTRVESDDLIKTVQMRIAELEEQIEENCTYRSRELVNHEITTLKWVLSVRGG